MADSSEAVPPQGDKNGDNTFTPATASILKNGSGWDGKLRVDRRAEVKNADGDDTSDNDEEDKVPVEQLEADEDLLADCPEDTDFIDLVHSRVSSMAALNLDRFRNVDVSHQSCRADEFAGLLKNCGADDMNLCLRQNSISKIALPDSFADTLIELDLYDNVISHIRGLSHLTKLHTLDLSFNKIKHIRELETLTELTTLYFVENRIQRIENLDQLVKLRSIELGGNRIRDIENLEKLTALQELWLGKNKITELKGLSTLQNLKILSIQSNRITHITGLSELPNLEELYISHNQITSLTISPITAADTDNNPPDANTDTASLSSALKANTLLRVLDISSNPVSRLSPGLSPLANLEEVWASESAVDDFGDVEKALADKPKLETVYFEGTPLQRSQPALYRGKVKMTLPQVRQIDATFVKVD